MPSCWNLYSQVRTFRQDHLRHTDVKLSRARAVMTQSCLMLREEQSVRCQSTIHAIAGSFAFQRQTTANCDFLEAVMIEKKVSKVPFDFKCQRCKRLMKYGDLHTAVWEGEK